MSTCDDNSQAWEDYGRLAVPTSRFNSQQRPNKPSTQTECISESQYSTLNFDGHHARALAGQTHPAPNVIPQDDTTRALLSQVLFLIPTASPKVLQDIFELLTGSTATTLADGKTDTACLDSVSCKTNIDFVHTIQNSVEPTLATADQTWDMNDHLMSGAQFDWMPSVQIDPLVASPSFDAGQSLISCDSGSESMHWVSFTDNFNSIHNGSSPASGNKSIQALSLNKPLPQIRRDSSQSVQAVVPYLIHPERLDSSRDSVQSSSSYDSANTGRSTSSKHSSKVSVASSVGSRSVRSLGSRGILGTMSSGTGFKKGHSRSTSNSSNTMPSNIPCTEPDCQTTFTRESDRDRHMSTQHDDVLYECLLNTCTSRCPKHCQDPKHSCGFPRARRDKVRKHLETVHGWKITAKDIPQSWTWSYIRQQVGWSCRSCGAFLGNWTENSDVIAGHADVCNDGLPSLPSLVKKMSM